MADLRIQVMAGSRNRAVPGDSLPFKFRVENISGAAVYRLTLKFVVNKADFTYDSGNSYIDCGQVLSSGGSTTIAIQLNAGNVTNWLDATIDFPESLREEFAQYKKRTVPVYLRYTMYDGMGVTAKPSGGVIQINHVTLLNHIYAPSIDNFYLERCEDGIPSDEGEKLLTTLKINYNDGDMDLMPLRLYYAQGLYVDETAPYIDLSSKFVQLKEGVVDSTSLITQTFSNGHDWAFKLVFGDSFEKVIADEGISRAFANLHLSGKANGGVCVGGFSKSTDENPLFECHYQARFYGNVLVNGKKLVGASDYSTDEVDTGVKWIDGKPIYRKVVQVGGIGNSASKDTALNTEAMGAVVSVSGMGYTSGGIVRPIPFVNPNNTTDNTSLTIRSYASSPVIRINTGSSGALAEAVVIIEYTKAVEVEVNSTLDYGELDIMILG